MFNVCPKCGEYREDKIIDDLGPYAICPICRYAHKFIKLPMFVVTGASGAGKSTVCVELTKILPEAVALETDILWRKEFNQPEDNYRSYRETWLRVCKNISQNGRPVVLCGSTIPSQFEKCVESRYFTQIYYIILVCDDDTLKIRLRQRPAWRDSSSDKFIHEHIRFNNWLKENSLEDNSSIMLINTSKINVRSTAKQIACWIREKI